MLLSTRVQNYWEILKIFLSLGIPLSPAIEVKPIYQPYATSLEYVQPLPCHIFEFSRLPLDVLALNTCSLITQVQRLYWLHMQVVCFLLAKSSFNC